MSFRRRMCIHLHDWQNDLPPAWQEFFQDCPALDFGLIPDVPMTVEALIWPGRRNVPLANAPGGANICRAFEGLQPAEVRVVVLGQDPYPMAAKATGRAFEDGAWQLGGRPEGLADSLKRLMLAAFATQEGRADLFRAGSWPALLRAGELELPAIDEYFDTLAGQGVLFTNAAWTHSQNEHLSAHRSLWKPVTNYLLHKLAREDQAVVFLLFGNDAKETFYSADIVFNQSAVVVCTHPRDQGFLRQENPLERVNTALLQLDADPIRWWN